MFYLPITSFIITYNYAHGLFVNILPSNWFGLAHLPIFFPTEIFLHIVTSKGSATIPNHVNVSRNHLESMLESED